MVSGTWATLQNMNLTLKSVNCANQASISPSECSVIVHTKKGCLINALQEYVKVLLFLLY